MKLVLSLPPYVGDYVSFFSVIIFLSKYYEKIYLLIIPRTLFKHVLHNNELRNPSLETKKKYLDNVIVYLENLFYSYNNIQIINLESINKISKLKNDIIHLFLPKQSNGMINKLSINDYCKCFNIDQTTNKIIDLYHNREEFCNSFTIDEKYKSVCNTPDFNKTGAIVKTSILNLNYKIILDFYDFRRNKEKEGIVCDEILNKYKLNKSDKFNIVIQNISLAKAGPIPKKYINNSFTNINISMICEFPGLLIPLLEKAEEIHLIDVSTTILIYNLQYKSILSRNLKIYYHSYYRILPHSKRNHFQKYLNQVQKHNVNWKCNWTIIKDR
jgi:hypothetical protein